MNKIIAITNQKGGVGKTTTSYNLASALSKYNKRILLIDLDPQGNCALALGMDPTSFKTTTAELLSGEISLKKAIHETGFENVSIIPANMKLAMVESSLQKEGTASTFLLRERLKDPIINLFDYVILDCPPSLGFLSLNGLTASNYLIVPVQCEYFALDALAQLLSTVYQVQSSNNPALEIMGILLTMSDSRTKLCIDIAQEIRGHFKEKVFQTEIPRNVSIPEAIAKGMPVNRYKPTSAGALTYANLAREVMDFVDRKEKE